MTSDRVLKRAELLANIAIIVVALLLGVVLVKRYLLNSEPPPGAPAAARLPAGAKVSLDGVDWGKSEATLVMVLSTNCHFCTESAPFYQRLAQEKSLRGRTRLVAVLPQEVGESQSYLRRQGVAVDEVRQAEPRDLQVSGTPTLILADKTGSVIETWVGKLPPGKEAEVLAKL